MLRQQGEQLVRGTDYSRWWQCPTQLNECKHSNKKHHSSSFNRIDPYQTYLQRKLQFAHMENTKFVQIETTKLYLTASCNIREKDAPTTTATEHMHSLLLENWYIQHICNGNSTICNGISNIHCWVLMPFHIEDDLPK